MLDDRLRPLPKTKVTYPVAVAAVRQISPCMRRVTLAGDAVSGLAISRPAQWIKVFVPVQDGERAGRAYTIRAWRPADGEIDVDFVLHGHGPCSSWAARARPGDAVTIGSPRSGFAIAPGDRTLLLGGDETALPAIGAIIEAEAAATTIHAIIEIPDEADWQALAGGVATTIEWIVRPKGAPAGDRLVPALVAAREANPASALWLAAEAAAVQRVRQHFQQVLLVPRDEMTTKAYWKYGAIDFKDE